VSAQFREPTYERVRALLRDGVGCKLAVIGDAMLDVYLQGRVGRISPEAPVPVFEIEREERFLGGAANVAKCLVALGAQVRLCAVVGDDAEGRIVRDEAQGLGIGVAGVLTAPDRPTTSKCRLIARHQQMGRLDREQRTPLSRKLEAQLLKRIREAVKWADAVILSDYLKGVLTSALCRAAIASARGKPVVVDPKGRAWAKYAGATVLKPNRGEAQDFTGAPLDDEPAAARAAQEIRKRVGVKHCLITRGERGMTLAESVPGQKPPRLLHLLSRPREVFDVTGAGDVVAATLALSLAAGAELSEAAWLANLAAGVKVAKFGAASVSDQELLDAAASGAPLFERKLMTRAQAAAFAAEYRRRGRKVVFTNGCFDILHLGHVSYLEKARRLGDALIVGVNSDASVTRLKGPGRPVQPEYDRTRILGAQACIDAVVLFDEDTPHDLIKALKPDVLCKGADYKRKQNVVGWEMVEKWGGRVELIELLEGRSTTSLIEKSNR
jgi:D-beta-D-heptose 7-phosphate kinase/D-beta-D-heptose 1-phosphate adenosyltransferase